MTNKLIKLSLALFTLLFASCSNNNKYIEIDGRYIQSQPKNVTANYVPNINIITKDEALKKYIMQNEGKKFNVTNSNFAVLDLFIETSLEPDPLEKQQPNLVGILKKRYQSYNYKVNYKLVDTTGNTVKQGESLGISSTKVETIANNPKNPSDSSIQDAAKEIVKDLNSNINDLLIDFKVVSVSDTSVFIMVNDGIVLSKEDVFLVNQLPSTALQLVKILQSNGLTLAELKVLTGKFPQAGMTVNLQK